MLKGLGILVVSGVLAVGFVGLAGGGPWWFRYVGSGAVFALLLLILGIVSTIPSKQDLAQRVAADAQAHDQNAPREMDYDGENTRERHTASSFRN